MFLMLQLRADLYTTALCAHNEQLVTPFMQNLLYALYHIPH